MTLFVNQQISDKKSPQHQDRAGLIYPVLSADTLLSKHESQLLTAIRTLSGLDRAVFDHWCLPLLHRYAEFVQVLPSVNNEVLGGLLNDALGRTAYVLRHLDHPPSQLDADLYRLVVISASIFFEVATVLDHYAVVICGESGEFIDNWQPFQGSLRQCGAQQYWFYEVTPRYGVHRKSINLLLARQLMPPALFELIANHPDLLSLWLDSFEGESEGGVQLRKYLTYYRHGDAGRGDGEVNVSIASHEAEDNAAGRALLDRLREEIAIGSIKVNTPDALIHVVGEGVFVDYRIFVHLVDLMRLPVNNRAVYLQVGNLMGIPKKCGQDYVHAQYFSETPETKVKASRTASQFGFAYRVVHEGMLLPDARVLFRRHQIPGVSSYLTAVHPQKYRQTLPAVAATDAKQRMQPGLSGGFSKRGDGST